MADRRRLLSVRLNEREWASLEEAAKTRGLTRGEAAREALEYGLWTMAEGRRVDLSRLAFIMERMQASLDLMIELEYPSAAADIEKTAQAHMEEFHS